MVNGMPPHGEHPNPWIIRLFPFQCFYFRSKDNMKACRDGFKKHQHCIINQQFVFIYILGLSTPMLVLYFLI